MWKRYFIIFSLIFIYESGFSQTTYLPSELEDFVSIYMTSKSKEARNTEPDEALFSKYQISRARYQQISQASISGKKIELDTNEKEFFEALQKLKDLKISEKENKTKELCLQNDLPFSKYNSILEKYKTDIAFQRSLQPYFKNYFNRQR